MNDYNMQSARTEAQIAKMKRLQRENICAFCPQHFGEFRDNPIELQTDYWTVSRNDYPYEGTSLHLLLIPKEHVSTMAELSQDARAEFLEVVASTEAHYKLFTYGLAMRVGDMRYNGGSVRHMHAHIIVGDFSDPDNHQTVRFKFSSVPKE